jgi:DNA-binding MarR family transcriptional regulator
MSKVDAPAYATTLHIRDHCLCLAAQRAARALARHFDEAFRPLGLTNGQFSLLMSLNRPEPPTMGAVAELLAMDRTTLTAALKPLARSGLVEVRPDSTDRRARRLALTAAGKQLLVAASEIWRTTHATLDEKLAEGQAGDLAAQLAKVPSIVGSCDLEA